MAEMRKDVKWQCDEAPQPHEANYLKLDSSKAHNQLNWQPRWQLQTALQKTLEWHEAWRRAKTCAHLRWHRLRITNQRSNTINHVAL